MNKDFIFTDRPQIKLFKEELEKGLLTGEKIDYYRIINNNKNYYKISDNEQGYEKIQSQEMLPNIYYKNSNSYGLDNNISENIQYKLLYEELKIHFDGNMKAIDALKIENLRLQNENEQLKNKKININDIVEFVQKEKGLKLEIKSE